MNVVIHKDKIVHVFTKKSPRYVVEIGEGDTVRKVAIQSTHTGDIDWLAPGYSVKTCVIAPRPADTHPLATPGPLSDPVMVDGVPTRAREWTPPDAESLAAAVYDEHHQRLSDAFQAVGFTRSADLILNETTRRFSSLLGKKTNGGLSGREQVLFDALKQFDAHFITPLDQERDRILGAMATGSETEPNWPEFTAAIQGELETIAAILLGMV